jgi:ABC-2 type transport system ATP-binding protein
VTTVAADIARQLTGAHDFDVEDGLIRFRVPRGDTTMPELLRALDAKDIVMSSIQVTRPTLDDVFLTLTGRSLRDAEQGASQPEVTHVA